MEFGARQRMLAFYIVLYKIHFSPLVIIRSRNEQSLYRCCSKYKYLFIGYGLTPSSCGAHLPSSNIFSNYCKCQCTRAVPLPLTNLFAIFSVVLDEVLLQLKPLTPCHIITSLTHDENFEPNI